VVALGRGARRLPRRLPQPRVGDAGLVLVLSDVHRRHAPDHRVGIGRGQRRDSVLHAKTAVIDDVWSTIGSSNVDWRSFCHNDEVNVSVLGGEFGREMTALFDDDLAASDEVTLEEWERRGPATRLGEWLARRWEFLL
jgi:cardiolipin synthase A/B